MPPESPRKSNDQRRILSRVAPEEFVGRAEELRRIQSLAAGGAGRRGLLLLLAPAAGISELLRQAYDEIFNRHDAAIPILFASHRGEETPCAAAQRFFHTFLQQFIAFRTRNPALVESSLLIEDLLELAPAADAEWIEGLVESYRRASTGGDDRAFVRLCLNAPQRAVMRGLEPFVLFDAIQLAGHSDDAVSLASEVVQSLVQMGSPFVLAGMRRRILDLAAKLRCSSDDVSSLRLDRLGDIDARILVEQIAERRGVQVNEQTRDLIVQQFNASPFFMTALIQSARDRGLALTNFTDCQRIYVDEIMGGRINRYFELLLEEIAPSVAARRLLIRLLFESLASHSGKSPVEIWRKRLGLSEDRFQRVMRDLHVQEMVSVNASFVTVEQSSLVWQDYLRASYRMEVAGEPRALVVADTILETLKRAPQTMARHYRRQAAMGLRGLLERFNCQRVPASLLRSDRFVAASRGATVEEINQGLDAETDLIRLPQIVHVASCAAFDPPVEPACDEERCAVGHGFDAGSYTDANEVVWIAAEVDSKLEAGRGMTEVWCDRLTSMARVRGFKRVRLWLIAREGFSAEANQLLAEREAFGSSHRQLELLTSRLGFETEASAASRIAPDEFQMVIPMGEDNELISAQLVEQIARRVDFKPEDINQIKTALVEACINASEHSLSPDRKIYQRFSVEDDKLVITISSRGVVPPNLAGKKSENGFSKQNGREDPESARERRGWGLQLIQTLMDEVEFERVDDGTRLRMAKYLRK